MNTCISINMERMGVVSVKWNCVLTRHLFSNQMRTINANLFQDLTSLQDLNLNRKLITIIVANLFQWSMALEILTLKSNRITTLDGNLFQGLTALQHFIPSNIVELNDKAQDPFSLIGNTELVVQMSLKPMEKIHIVDDSAF